MRQTLKDTTLPRGGGPDGKSKVFVRKDQQVNYTVYALHRMKDLWGSDEDEFKPERWMGRKLCWEYLPFNGGPRVCLGREFHLSKLKPLGPIQANYACMHSEQFAMTEVSDVTVRLMQRFDKLKSEGPNLVAKHNLSLNSSRCPGENVVLHVAT